MPSTQGRNLGYAFYRRVACRGLGIPSRRMANQQTTFFGLPKLPARYASLVLPFFLTCVMTCVVSGISTLRVAGLGPGVLGTWLVSWSVSWAVAYPTMLLVLPWVRRLVAALVHSE